MESRSPAGVISLDVIRGRSYVQSRDQDNEIRPPLTPGTQPHTESLSSLRGLSERLVVLEKELKEIKQLLNEFLTFDDLIELRDLPFEQVKEEIALYFREHDDEDIGYEDLIGNLKIEPKLVVQACNELIEEGKIG